MSEATIDSGSTPLLQRITDRFLPVGIAQDRETSNQARMFLASHTLGPFLGNTVPLALALVDPTPQLDVALLALSISLFWAFPFLLRCGVPYHLLVVLSVINLNFCILWSCYHYGGVASPTLTWVLIIPLLSLFYIGGEKRLQPHLLTVTGGAFALFLAAYLLLPPGPDDLPPAATLSLGAVSMTATLSYVAVMAIYYARVFDAGVDLEHEVERRRAMGAELRRAVIAADRASAAKTEFLARMSHELRMPLNAILGYGQVLREDARETRDDAMGQDVERILDAGHYLLRLIDTVLDLSKLETGRMSFDIRAHCVADLLETAVAPHRPAIEAAGLSVDIEVELGLDRVEIDGGRLLQVLDSIVENAVRHTSAGGLTFSASCSAEESFTIAVHDTGCGIEPETLPALFNTFTIERHGDGRPYGGNGLKLAVCAQLCRAMGGTIEADSIPGNGSTFMVTLPRHGRHTPQSVAALV